MQVHEFYVHICFNKNIKLIREIAQLTNTYIVLNVLFLVFKMQIDITLFFRHLIVDSRTRGNVMNGIT